MVDFLSVVLIWGCVGVDGALFRGETRTTSHSEDHGFMEHGGTGSFGEDLGGSCFFDDFSLNRLFRLYTT
jgi:hypothetical protein